jgi:hypothetical protein
MKPLANIIIYGNESNSNDDLSASAAPVPRMLLTTPAPLPYPSINRPIDPYLS